MKCHRSQFTIIGHRGSGSGIHPGGGTENSRRSFDFAFAAGADEVECDLSISSDGKVFLYHNECIKIGLFKEIKIADLTLRQIRNYEKDLLTFRELTRNFTRKKFILEFKECTDYRRICDIVCESNLKDKIEYFKFVSFSIDALKYVKKKDASFFCSYIATSTHERFQPFAGQDHIQICLDNGIDAISGHWLGIRPKIIQKARAAGLEIELGFIDSKMAFKYCLKHGINRLYTNKIDKLLLLINSVQSVNNT